MLSAFFGWIMSNWVNILAAIKVAMEIVPLAVDMFSRARLREQYRTV